MFTILYEDIYLLMVSGTKNIGSCVLVYGSTYIFSFDIWYDSIALDEPIGRSSSITGMLTHGTALRERRHKKSVSKFTHPSSIRPSPQLCAAYTQRQSHAYALRFHWP